MSILFIGKRFYTNRDAYLEKFGRIYQLPYYWSKETLTSLWLIDYHSKEKIKDKHNSLSILSTPILSLTFIFNIFRVILIQRPKKIVASGDCYIGLFSYLLAKLCRAKFVFDVYDKYDVFDGYRNLGFKNLFIFLLKKSHLNLFASPKLMIFFQKISQHSYLVPNAVHKDCFKPYDIQESRKFFQLDKDNIYIGYFGSMEPERGIDDLIAAVKIVRKQDINLHILLGGKKRTDLNLNEDFIKYLGNIPYNQVAQAMSCCNFLALPYRNSEFLDNASSCKISEYAALKKVIITTDTPNITTMLKTKDPYFLAKPNTPSSLASLILHGIEHPFTLDIFEDTWDKIAAKTLNQITKTDS